MDKVKKMTNLFYYNTKTLPKGIDLFALIYGIGILILVHILHFLNISPIYIGEYLLTPLGILLLTHIAVYEWETNIYELTYPRTISHFAIVFQRVIKVLVELFAIIAGVLFTEKLLGYNFNLSASIFGSFITATFLGLIGMILAYITKQRTVGYIAPFVYYMLDMFTQGKYTKALYLFGLLNNDFSSKYNLLLLSILLVIGFFLYLYRKV